MSILYKLHTIIPLLFDNEVAVKDPEVEDIIPTPQQDELFQLTISSFINMASSHCQVFVNSRFSPTLADIDKWQKKEDLPELSKRSHLMDFIWTHYCNCKCD